MSKKHELLGELTGLVDNKEFLEKWRAAHGGRVPFMPRMFFALLIVFLAAPMSAHANGLYQQNRNFEPIQAEQILCVNADGRSWKVGTTTVLSPDTRLTAHHVVEGCKIIYIGNKSYNVEYTDSSIDLAVLGSGRDFRRLNCDAVPRGRRVMLRGYPEGSQQQVVSQGKTSRSGRGRFASVEGFAVKGMSGGPVTEDNGRLAGIFQAYKGTSRYWYVPGPAICASLQNFPGAMFPRNPYFNSYPDQSLPLEYPKVAEAIPNQANANVKQAPMRPAQEGVLVADASGRIPALTERRQVHVSAYSNNKANWSQNITSIAPERRENFQSGQNHISGQARPILERFEAERMRQDAYNERARSVGDIDIKRSFNSSQAPSQRVQAQAELSLLEQAALARGLSQMKSDKKIDVIDTAKVKKMAELELATPLSKLTIENRSDSRLADAHKPKTPTAEEKTAMSEISTADPALESPLKSKALQSAVKEYVQSVSEKADPPNLTLNKTEVNSHPILQFLNQTFIQNVTIRFARLLNWTHSENASNVDFSPHNFQGNNEEVVSIMVASDVDRAALLRFIDGQGLKVVESADIKGSSYTFVNRQ